MRIVSLLPSATEILFALGAGPDMVGVTFECDFPEEARACRIVSDTTLTHGLTPAQIDAEVRARLEAGEDLYTLDEGALRELDPDLVVTQDLCAVCAVDITEVDKAMEHLGCRATVLTLDPMTLAEVLESIEVVGQATGTGPRAGQLVSELRRRLDDVASAVAGRTSPRVAMLEWTDPPFSAGHWVPDMVTAAGGLPALGTAGTRSTRVGWDAVTESRPDLVVVAPCGYRLDGATQLARQVVAAGVLPDGVPVWAVNADAAFVRPGPRVVDGVEALSRMCHRDLGPPAPDMATLVRA